MHHAPSPTPDPDSPAERVRGVLMHESLKALLDRVRGAREALPHLAALEAGLAKRGAAAVDSIAPAWRTRICAQLSSLPLAEDDAPLQDLLNRLLHGLQPAGGCAPQVSRSAPDSRFDMERTVVVREISHSEFMSVAGAQAPEAEA